MALAIVFFILTGIVFWVGVVGLIKPALVIRWGDKRNRKSVFKTYGSLWVVLFIVWIITLPKNSTTPATAAAPPQNTVTNSTATASSSTKPSTNTATTASSTATSTKVSSSKPVAPPSLKQVAENAVHQTIPSSNLMKNGDAFLGFMTDQNQLIVEVEAEDNLTHGLVKYGILDDSAKIMKTMFADKRVNDVLIDWFYPETDAYGNQTNQVAEKIEFTRSTESMINWDNFDPNNIPQIADDFEVNPTFDPGSN